MIVPGQNSGLTVAPFYISFIENEKVSKDKDTNFIRAILPSDRKLAKKKETKLVKENKRISA